MKDSAHHLRGIQKKILRLSRKEAQQVDNDHINNNELEKVVPPVERRNPKYFPSKGMKAQYL